MADSLKKRPTGVPGGPSATEGSSRAATPAQPARRYLVWMLAGILAALGAFYAGLFALQATDNLPPPAFSNSLCLDEKLSFLRENPAGSPNLLVIGSSVAWRHFDGATVAITAKGIKPLNGGFCGLHVNQAVFAANWLLDRQPTVKQVVLIAAPQDFGECSKKPEAVFNRDDADDYVYGGASPWPYYLKYFSPVSLLGNARRVKDRRANRVELNPLVFTAFGDGPLNTADSLHGLGYGRAEPLDPVCFEALESLAQRLHKEGRTFTVVSSPLNPEWKSREDAGGAFINDFDARLAQAMKPTQARYWDADSEWKTANTSFTDALHLRWSVVRDFSAALARQLEPAGAAPVKP